VSATELPLHIRRILVALDASAASIAALDAAATLAACMDAELLGLFVEDVNLLRLAGLPFASEIDMVSGSARSLAPAQMEQRLRAQATRAQESLSQAAGRRQLRWTFRVARGQVVTELLGAEIEADLIALGTVSTPVIRRARVGSTAQAVIERAARTLLILPHGAPVRTPVGVLFDESPASARAFVLAAQLTQAESGDLIVFLLADDAESEQRLRETAVSLLEPLQVKARYRWLVDADTATLARAVRDERIGTLALAADSDALDAQTVHALLERVECAVLLVR
jgi:nucleotide-binding universal stress UspA family protein